MESPPSTFAAAPSPQVGENKRNHSEKDVVGSDEKDILPFPTLQPNPLPAKELLLLQQQQQEKNAEQQKTSESSSVTTTTNNTSGINTPYKNSNNTQTQNTSANPSYSSSFTSLLTAFKEVQSSGNYSPVSEKNGDAGNRPLDHYRARLPGWRNNIRNALLPLIRWETPYLARVQQWVRTPALDLYFGLSANLGTHTFYVIVLPLGFWLGAPTFSRSLTILLAFGVLITGVIKDLLCLPRPLSPPLHRISMSGSAALEYGFPSTHSANAVSVGLLLYRLLADNYSTYSEIPYYGVGLYYFLQSLNLLYVLTIILGRVYCGMHGFMDVIAGTSIGAALYWIRAVYGTTIDKATLAPECGYMVLSIVVSVIILIRIHPEPADDCPCFDDAVAFMGVVAGIFSGQWHYSLTHVGSYGAIPYSYQMSGIVGTLLRLAFGVGLIAIWRPSMKRALHQLLPPLFRLIERSGFAMPRRFFTPASEYKTVPAKISDATFVEPYAFSSLFSGLRSAKRADSVGPQSTADVYESIAYRRYNKDKSEHQKDEQSYNDDDDSIKAKNDADDANDEAEMLSHITRPRVKYDVEVVTKLIVYTGVAFIATDICGVLFPLLNI